MRLSKRLAVGVLAAVMALSMTACGGNPNENPSSSGSNASSSSSSSASSGSNSNSSSSSASSDSNSENKVTGISRIDKYFSRLGIDVGKPYYCEVEDLTAPRKGQITKRTSDGNRIGLVCYSEGFNFPANIYDKKTKDEYTIYTNDTWGREENVNIILYYTGTYKYSGYDDWPVIKSGTLVKPTLCNVNGVEYYAEKVAVTLGDFISCYYYCFDIDDVNGMNLRYIVNVSDDETTMFDVYKVNAIKNQANMDMLRLPEGYRLSKNNVEVGITSKDNYPN